MKLEELIAAYKAQGMPQSEIDARIAKYTPDENGDYTAAIVREGAEKYNKKVLEAAERNRFTNNLKLGADVGLNAYKFGKSIADIEEAKAKSAELQGRVPNFQTLGDNRLLQDRLYEAKLDTTRGLTPAVRDELYRRNLQAFNNQIRNNYANAGGQSGIGASLNQASALDRVQGNIGVANMDAQQQAQNKALYDQLIGQQQQQRMFQSRQDQERFASRDMPLWRGQMQAINAQRMAGQQNMMNALEQVPYQIGNIAQAATRPSLAQQSYVEQPVDRGMTPIAPMQERVVEVTPPSNPSMDYIRARYGKKYSLPTRYTGLPNYQSTNDITNY